MSFDKGALPDWHAYADSHGMVLEGRGPWRTTYCDLHGGSSLRVKPESGGWRCMNCQEKGGDVLGYHMARTGLTFVAAARALGAWRDDGRGYDKNAKALPLSARDAMQVCAQEALVLVPIISDLRQGIIPDDGAWRRFLSAAGRIEALAVEYRS